VYYKTILLCLEQLVSWTLLCTGRKDHKGYFRNIRYKIKYRPKSWELFLLDIQKLVPRLWPRSLQCLATMCTTPGEQLLLVSRMEQSVLGRGDSRWFPTDVWRCGCSDRSAMFFILGTTSRSFSRC